VATYEDERITTSKVINHRSNGIDTIFTVQTLSGKILRANERHPFLVEQNGERKWVRLRDLKPGMSLVVVRDAADLRDPNGSPDCAPPAKPRLPTTESILTPPAALPGTMENGLVNLARMKDALNRLNLKVIVRPTTTRSGGHRDIAGDNITQNTGAISASRVGMGLLKLSTIACLRRKTESALSVISRLLLRIPARIGTASSASITATTPEKSGGCSVTTAISPLGMGKPLKSSPGRLSIYDVVPDEIVSISPAGKEEVFDVGVERTENFIANGVISHNTRWSKLDLTGQIVDHMTKNDDSDQWEVVEFPAILNEKPLWPDFWSLDELLAKKASMDPRYWQAQYMQQPTSEEGALIKREWWNIWEEDSPPPCEFVIMALDAAQEKNNRADYNALTVWGVFLNESTGVHNIILLNAIKERLEFPELKQMVLNEYKEWEPDSFIVEKKSNGAALYQEMRRMGLPLMEFTPGKGQDKISRVNAVTDLFAAGIVWAPDRRWAREVVEECNDFPAGRNDDLVDSTTLALLRFRQGGFIKLPSDEPEPIQWFKSSRARSRGYY
jgi:predicted phage terminase large subunit-like protein